MSKDIIRRMYKDLKYSAGKMNKLHREIKNDFKFEQGSQWRDKDVEYLRRAGVKAITVNKVKPIIKLLTGIERQSQSDPKVFPEGGEDNITSEISTRLLKNVSKNSNLHIKQSEVFKNGAIGGMCFVEPYMDYSFDLINGDLKWKKISAQKIYLDPDFQEYDLSDSKFIIKVTTDLSKDDLLALFPDDEKKIDKISNGKIDFENIQTMDVSRETDDYPAPESDSPSLVTEKEEDVYDLIDYYYKKLEKKYFAVIQTKGVIKQFDSEEEANNFILQTGEYGVVIDRLVPVIMHAQAVGATELYNDVAWSYPKWKSYPIMPFFAELITEDLDDFSLKIQGVVRGIKDLNEEYNKRRTQELRHLNSSANSGFDVEKGALDESELAKLKKYGSSPGIVIQRKKGYAPISRITPMALSQGHSQLAAENAQDLKEASGVNPDLLANDSQSQSGRAILLKQRQGLAMIQEMLDNFSITKKLIGRFILSQFSELFTVETAMRVLGDEYISDNFTVPTSIVIDRALVKTQKGEELTDLEESTILQYPNQQYGEVLLDENQQPITMVDMDTAIQVVNKVLTDSELNKYDVAIGEGPYQETIRMANFMDIKELAQQGVPIPPQSLIETSMLPDAEKKNILRSLAQQAQIAQAKPATEQ